MNDKICTVIVSTDQSLYSAIKLYETTHLKFKNDKQYKCYDKFLMYFKAFIYKVLD